MRITYKGDVAGLYLGDPALESIDLVVESRIPLAVE